MKACPTFSLHRGLSTFNKVAVAMMIVTCGQALNAQASKAFRDPLPVVFLTQSDAEVTLKTTDIKFHEHAEVVAFADKLNMRLIEREDGTLWVIDQATAAGSLNDYAQFLSEMAASFSLENSTSTSDLSEAARRGLVWALSQDGNRLNVAEAIQKGNDVNFQLESAGRCMLTDGKRQLPAFEVAYNTKAKNAVEKPLPDTPAPSSQQIQAHYDKLIAAKKISIVSTMNAASQLRQASDILEFLASEYAQAYRHAQAKQIEFIDRWYGAMELPSNMVDVGTEFSQLSPETQKQSTAFLTSTYKDLGFASADEAISALQSMRVSKASRSVLFRIGNGSTALVDLTKDP